MILRTFPLPTDRFTTAFAVVDGVVVDVSVSAGIGVI
jgi:hypothetical protein